LHVVIATRADPPLPIYRYRARGELTEIRQVQLSFTLDETRDFLHQTAGDIIRQEEIEFLHQRTEGWAVGLQLAGLSLQGRGSTSDAIIALSGNQLYIMEYLVNEVFNHQSERVKEFLLKTSILERLTGPLCNQLTDSKDGYATLEYLNTKNLFVTALDSEQIWYRYHQLFLDFLRRRLEREQQAILPQLHQTASEWYLQNGFLSEAIDHAISSGNHAYTVSLIEKLADTIWARGEQSRLLRQIQSLPAEIVHSSTCLCSWYSLLLFYEQQHKQGKELLQIAEILARKNTQSSKQHLNDVLGIKALQDAQVSLDELDMNRAIQSANEALAHLQEQWKVPRLMAQMILADALAWQGDMNKASQAYSELLTASRLQHNPYMYDTIALRIPFVAYHRGRLREAYDFCLQNLERLCKLKPRLPQIEGIFHIAIAQVLVEWNHLEETRTYLDKAYAIYEIGSYASPEDFYSRMIRGYIACDQVTCARQIIDLIEQAIRSEQLPRYDLSQVLAWKARIHLLEGRRELAEKVLSEIGPIDPTAIAFSDEAAHLCQARIWILRGEHHRAIELLEALHAFMQNGGHISRLIEVLILRASAEASQKDLQTAREYLNRAISLAEAEGFIRIFVEGGGVIRDLLAEMVATGHGTAYIRQLIDAFESPQEGFDGKRISGIEPFSEREQQVLRLLMTHLSQREMADELCVSVNTIRFHTKNIYRKLGAHERSEAVGKAKAAGLL